MSYWLNFLNFEHHVRRSTERLYIRSLQRCWLIPCLCQFQKTLNLEHWIPNFPHFPISQFYYHLFLNTDNTDYADLHRFYLSVARTSGFVTIFAIRQKSRQNKLSCFFYPALTHRATNIAPRLGCFVPPKKFRKLLYINHEPKIPPLAGDRGWNQFLISNFQFLNNFQCFNDLISKPL